MGIFVIAVSVDKKGDKQTEISEKDHFQPKNYVSFLKPTVPVFLIGQGHLKLVYRRMAQIGFFQYRRHTG